MSLADEITKIALKSRHTDEHISEQLNMLDKIESVLKKLGVSLEPKFEIPLSRRIIPFVNEKNA